MTFSPMFARIFKYGLRCSSPEYIFRCNLYTLYKEEFNVIPFCTLNVNVPYNITIIPLDLYKYPNCDKVIVSVKGNEKLDCKIKCSNKEDVVNVLSRFDNGRSNILCAIEAPVKANIHALSENGNIAISNFNGDTVEVKTGNGNISAGKCVCEKIVLSSSSGNITCKGILQAAHINLSTGENGNIATEKLQGLNLLAKTVNGNIQTKSTYCNDSSFSTEDGNLILANVHKNCKVICGTNGKLHMTGFDGTLEAVIQQGNISIDMVRIEGNSKITIEREGSLNLKLTEECVENTSFKLFTKALEISPDLNVIVDIKENYKVMKTRQAKIHTEIQCPHSNVVIKNLSWREMFNLTER